ANYETDEREPKATQLKLLSDALHVKMDSFFLTYTPEDEMAKQKISARKAKHGEKMIELKVRFWTNDIAPGKDSVLPKNAWACGVVRMQSNESHEIVAENPLPFNSLMDLPAAIEKVLIKHGIVLHASDKMEKYFK
ncbi:MAG: hypothetical protein V3T30_06740, partial [Thermodesulfobacteriota bacterium]